MNRVIEANKLVKKYDKLIAVDGISFHVLKGEIFGLLGENGAGKTTTLEIIEGLRKPTAGEFTILGHTVTSKYPDKIKERIGRLILVDEYAMITILVYINTELIVLPL